MPEPPERITGTTFTAAIIGASPVDSFPDAPSSPAAPGFIGSNFVQSTIAATGEPIVNLDKLTYAGSLRNLEALRDDARHVFVQGDIAERALVRSLLQKHKPRAIVHLAAESHVDRSIAGPAASSRPTAGS